jgi:hypothetical protein
MAVKGGYLDPEGSKAHKSPPFSLTTPAFMPNAGFYDPIRHTSFLHRRDAYTRESHATRGLSNAPL